MIEYKKIYRIFLVITLFTVGMNSIDNNYIYALYWGKERWGMHEIPYVNTIHVFDWHGKLIQKLETDYDIDKMFLDTVRDRLCVTRPRADNIYCLDLAENIIM